MTRAKDISKILTDADFSGTLDVAGAITGTSATLTGDITASSLNGGQFGGRRNIIINGAMQVAQRGADNLNITSASGGAYACDRFKLYLSLGGTAQFDLQQVSEAPTGSGFSKSTKLSCDVTDTLTANNYLFLTYRMEGQDLQNLKKGTSDAESVTLSFWLKSNKATSGQVNIRDTQNARMISKTYTVSASDTWQYITLTFDGDTSGVLTNDNANRLAIEFFLDSGTTYSSGATPTSWEALSTGDRNATNFGLVSSTSNYWQITGIQLEVGEQATPFEHRSYGEELVLCQRYYQQHTYSLRFQAAATGTLRFPQNIEASMRVQPTTATLTTPSTTTNVSSVGVTGNYIQMSASSSGDTRYEGGDQWQVSYDGEL